MRYPKVLFSLSLDLLMSLSVRSIYHIYISLSKLDVWTFGQILGKVLGWEHFSSPSYSALGKCLANQTCIHSIYNPPISDFLLLKEEILIYNPHFFICFTETICKQRFHLHSMKILQYLVSIFCALDSKYKCYFKKQSL